MNKTTDAQGVRVATLRVLAEQLNEARRTCVILEADYQSTVVGEATAAGIFHMVGDQLNAWRAMAAFFVDAIEPANRLADDLSDRPDLRVDWCPSCMGQRSIRNDLCVICGTDVPEPHRSLAVLNGGAA